MEANLFLDARRDTKLVKVAASNGGEWAGPCPFCGGKDRFRVQPEKNRWLCRGCTGGRWKGPWDYYERRDGRQPTSIRLMPERKEKPKQYTWKADPWALIRQYESHPQRLELWQAYKPLNSETIERNHLGVGVLPASSCHHPRLIMPVLDGTMVVGLRGRRIDCDCANWMPAAGTPLDQLPMYNERALTPGCVAWLGENCADALMGTQRLSYAFLALYSVSYWRDAWTQTLVNACPELIVVALDNDLVGNGGADRRDEFIREWLKTHPRVPEASGPKIVNRLRQAGLNAVLYDWKCADWKADIGSMLMAGA